MPVQGRNVEGSIVIDTLVAQSDVRRARIERILEQRCAFLRDDYLSESDVRAQVGETLRRQRAVQERFLRLARRVPARRLAAARQEVDATVAGLREARRRLAHARAELARLERIASQAADVSEEARSNFERLLRHPRVQAVDMHGDRVVIYLDTVFIQQFHRRYEIGDFCLVCEPGTGGVEAVCLRSTNPTREHPHGSDRGICFGQASKRLKALAIQGDYYGVVDRALNVMTQPGPGLSDWAEVECGLWQAHASEVDTVSIRMQP